MRHRALLVLWLVIVWVGLWRDVSAANVVSGILVGIGVVWLYPPAESALEVRVQPLAMLRFLAVSGFAVLRANVVVAWEVLTPKNRINEGVVAVPLATRHPVVITMISHAIGLAPGTMVVDVEDDFDDRPVRLHVHVLHLEKDGVAARREVRTLERLALAAVGLPADSGSTTAADEPEPGEVP